MRFILFCAAFAVSCVYGNLCGVCDCEAKERKCPYPSFENIWVLDGVLRCRKGFYVKEVGVIDEFKNSITLYAEHIDLFSATCEGSAWKIDGMFLSGTQLTSFVCAPTPSKTGNCGALVVTEKNVQYNVAEGKHYCWDKDVMDMVITTPQSQIFRGDKLLCVNGDWKFTGVNSVSIPVGSKIVCEPKRNVMDSLIAFLPGTLHLLPIGKTPEGLTRWVCPDREIMLKTEWSVDGKPMPSNEPLLHYPSAFIDANNNFFKHCHFFKKETKGTRPCVTNSNSIIFDSSHTNWIALPTRSIDCQPHWGESKTDLCDYKE